MSAANVPLVIDQGEDFTCQISWTDGFNDPQNLVHPARMDIKDSTGAVMISLESPEDPEALPAGTIPGIRLSSQGVIQLHMTHTATAGISPGEYAYDLFVTVDDGNAYAGEQTHRLIYGQVTVNKRITEMT